MRTNLLPLVLALSFPASGCLVESEPNNLVPPTVAEDPSLPAIDLNGTRLHVEEFGSPDDPAILVLHGGPGSDYRGLLPLQTLADDGFHVVFFDQRGTGLSARHDTVSLDDYLEDLRLLIERYAPDQPVVLLCQSWGAMYATAFINEYGDYDGKIQGAIFTEPGGFDWPQLEGFLDRLMGSVSLVGEEINDLFWSGQFLSPADHERADYQYAQMSLHGPPAEHRDRDNPTPFWRTGAAVNSQMLAMAKRGFDWTTNLDDFPHKVLFLRGDLNEAATLEHQQELAAEYPDAEIETIENVGHHLIWERTDDYLTHARAYLREIGVAK